jgi:hypothetical protein
MAHGRRVFGGGRKAFKKYINIYDIKKGFEIYKLSKKNIDQSKRLTMMSMYT